MEDKLLERLDNLNIEETNLLLNDDINLSINSFTKRRIVKSVKKKTGHYSNNTFIEKITNNLGGIFMKKKMALALAATMILTIGGNGVYAYAKTPVAYVSVDINPSVELGVNAFDKVVSVEAYNEDGERILENTDLTNYKVDNAVSTLVTNAISDGYISDDGSPVVAITTVTDDDKIANELENSLKDVTDETLKGNDIVAEVKTEKLALARRDEARKLGITPGKLNLIQKLQKLDPTINVEDYKFSSVKEIQKKNKELRKNNKDDKGNNDNIINNEGNTVENETSKETLSETSDDSKDKLIAEPKENNKEGNNRENDKEDKTKEEDNKEVNDKYNNNRKTLEEQNNNSSKLKNNNSNSENNSPNSENNNRNKGKN